MPKIKIRPEHREQAEKIRDIIKNTRIIKREFELEYGKWNFVVAGSDGKNGIIAREGFARQARIFTMPVYSAAIADPNSAGGGGIPLEEFVSEDIPKEMRGLEVYQVDPIRPLTITRTWKMEGSNSLDRLMKEYEEKTPAFILAPDERFWTLAVLKYLNECDDFFPDQFIQKIRERDFPLNARIVGSSTMKNRSMLN